MFWLDLIEGRARTIRGGRGMAGNERGGMEGRKRR